MTDRNDSDSMYRRDIDTIQGHWYQNGNWRFLLFNAVFGTVFFGLLRDLLVTSWKSDYFTYIPFIPFISAYLLYEKRQAIFFRKGSSLVPGFLLTGFGILLFLLGNQRKPPLEHYDFLAAVTFSMIVIWIGGFTLCYGARSLRATVFPLFFLLFVVPIPNVALERIILFLQTGSADISYWFLRATGMPIARDGFVFHLPMLNIEVAPQCSGIRSSLSLIITGVLAAYLFLRTGWARAVLMLSLVPIAIIKNSIRIASLSLLGVYVDESILGSDLHHKGGFLFFIIALAIAGGVLVLLRKLEKRFK